MSTGSIGSNGDQRRLDFGSPPPRGSAGLDAKFRRARSDRARKFAARSPPEGEYFFEETSCEGGLGFHTTRYPLAYSDRLFSSFRASTSETEIHRPSMWTHTPATPSPSRSGSTSADSGYLSQYDTDGNAHTPLMTGLPSLDMDAFPRALLRLRSPIMRTKPRPARPPGARTPPPSNRQLAGGGFLVRLPPFNLVDAPIDP